MSRVVPGGAELAIGAGLTMSPREFRALGYLQEANRRFFHPVGLMLAVRIDPGNEADEGELVIKDWRSDAEGCYFDPQDLDHGRARTYDEAVKSRSVARQRLFEGAQPLSNGVQPIGVRLRLRKRGGHDPRKAT